MTKLLLLLNKDRMSHVESVLKSQTDFPEWMALDPKTVLSLVAFLSASKEINTVLLEPGVWSPQHMASAAKLLRSRSGRLVMLGPRPVSMEKDIPLIIRTEDIKQVPLLLNDETEKDSVNLKAEKAGQQDDPTINHNSAPVKSAKLIIPERGEAMFISVAESQSNCGCMAQCIGLLRYLEKLGFSPALLMTPEQLEEKKAQGIPCKSVGYSIKLGNVPVSTDTRAGLYNAYVRYVGTLSSEGKKKFLGCDWSILVCGAGRDELQATARALVTMGNRKYASVIFSGVDAASALELAKSISYPWAVTRPVKESWYHADTASMQIYDRILLPWLTQKYSHQDYAWEHQKVVGI